MGPKVFGIGARVVIARVINFTYNTLLQRPPRPRLRDAIRQVRNVVEVFRKRASAKTSTDGAPRAVLWGAATRNCGFARVSMAGAPRRPVAR